MVNWSFGHDYNAYKFTSFDQELVVLHTILPCPGSCWYMLAVGPWCGGMHEQFFVSVH